MSQSPNSTPGLSLPQPTLETSGPVQSVPDPAIAQPQMQTQVQQILAAPQVQTAAAGPPASMSLQPMQKDVGMPPASEPSILGTNTPTPQAQPTVSSPRISDLDDDALDEEWVNKAKSIVEQNQADPFMESKALHKVKADYLQRRYGKQIKVSD